MFFTRKWTPRRKAWLLLLLPMLAFITWAWYEGIAFTGGITLEQMDWNNDGQLSQSEFLQAFYAVKVQDTVQDRRKCRIFSWRSDGTEIRRDCLTVLRATP